MSKPYAFLFLLLSLSCIGQPRVNMSRAVTCAEEKISGNKNVSMENALTTRSSKKMHHPAGTIRAEIQSAVIPVVGQHSGK